MIDKQQLIEVVNEALVNTDAFLVEVKISPSNEIVVEIDSDTSVDIDTCAKLTRTIESRFDREVEDYELEVGSAGLTSPFKVRRQYEKNIGNEVEVLTKDGRKLYGELLMVNEEGTEFTIAVPEKVKEPGMKRPEIRLTEVTLPIEGTKYVKYQLKFK